MKLSTTVARPLAASVLFGCCVAAAAMLLVVTLVSLQAAVAERDVKAEQIERLLHGRSAAGASGGPAGPHLLIDATSATLAAARLDGLVRATVADAGATVLASRAEPKADAGDLPNAIEVQASIGTTNDALQTILYRLETGAPLVFVNGLTIQPAEPAGNEARDGDARPGPAGSPDATLRVTLTLDAAWSGNGKANAPPTFPTLGRDQQ